MVTSQNGINLIKSFEGCRLTAYKDSVGVWTIGYGHTKNVTPGQTITQAQCDKFLASDLSKFEKNVEQFNPKYSWTQNEFDALVSFAYNVGSINGLTNKGTRSKSEIADKILLYNKAGGRTLPGLVKRRKAEHDMFISSSKKETPKCASYSQTQFIKDVQTIEGNTSNGVADASTLNITVTLSKVKNNKHKLVLPVQKYLKSLGYYDGELDCDFGNKTYNAVIKYQSKFLSSPDGVITKCGCTWRKLLGLL